MTICSCCSGQQYAECCQRFLEGKLLPQTPEALMRSRYTAYTMANMDYIQKTMRGRASIGFNQAEAKQWAKRMIWIKLEVLDTALEKQNHGTVEFKATFVDGYALQVLHEKSEFIQEAGQWYYVDGTQFPSNNKKTIPRNSPCPCNSQRKFKNCHGKN